MYIKKYHTFLYNQYLLISSFSASVEAEAAIRGGGAELGYVIKKFYLHGTLNGVWLRDYGKHVYMLTCTYIIPFLIYYFA